LQRQHQDASEATLAVLQRQQQTAEALRPEEQTHAITIDSENDQAIAWAFSQLA